MKIALVSVPWAALDMPPLGLGILANVARTVAGVTRVDVVNANLTWAEYVHASSGGAVDPANLDEFGRGTYGCGYSDWTFSAALHDVDQWRRREFEAFVGPEQLQRYGAMATHLHEVAAAFVDQLAEQLVSAGYDLVGCTSTFQQTAAAVALCNRLKRLRPEIVTVLGGANCDGPQGAALHGAYPSIDYVVRGEGERPFRALLEALLGDGPTAPIAGLCSRAPDGSTQVQPMATEVLPPSEYVSPDFDAYFHHLASSELLSRHITPFLVVEGSRGCWWGEKHHCTFCGLNGSFMRFRSKDGEEFARELVELCEKHRVLDVYVVDNILDMGYFTTFVPRLREAGVDVAIMCEVKSNLQGAQLEQLAAAGIRMIQPGIENLHSEPLKIMRKGVTGLQNIRILRDAQEHDITVAWNYLYGFPGERFSTYQELIATMPALHHLQPPGGAGRISIERFSPLFDDPSLGFEEKRPAEFYRLIFDLPDELLADMAYLFESPDRGLTEDQAAGLSEAISTWNRAHAASVLSWMQDPGGAVVLRNTRSAFAWETLVIEEPWQVAAFHELQAIRREASVLEALREQGYAVEADALRAVLADWRAAGLLVAQEGRLLCVATRAVNADWLRLGPAAEVA